MSDTPRPLTAEQANIQYAIRFLIAETDGANAGRRDDAIAALIAAVRADTLNNAKQAIIDACSMCGGHGWVPVQVNDGTEEGGVDRDRCEYCGRPCVTLDALLGVPRG